MSLFILVWSYLKARPLNTVINVVLLSLGIAVITILMLINHQLEEKISANARGIDLVVGAKGSPIQLILCNIFHIDFPTGNIKLKEADKIARNRLVKKAIPLALGDNYKSFRIVGTNQDYAVLYNATLAEGDWWKEEMEVAIGANVQELTHLRIGDRFVSAHGLSSEGSAHGDHQFTVKGVIAKTGTVLDNLILTGVASIWEMHEDHTQLQDHVKAFTGIGSDSTAIHSRLVPSVDAADSVKEVTSVLIQYRSPLGAVQLPRYINSQTSMQAASPAFETARLFSILGVGVDVLMGFGYVLVLISGLSIFIALYNSLKERRYDMAIMRSMGASRARLFLSIVMEGGLLTFLGSVMGLLTGHGVLIVLSGMTEKTQKAGVTGLVFYSQEWIILTGSLLLGVLCSMIPAVQAYRTDISRVLAGNWKY